MPRALLALVGAGSRTTPDQRANLQLSNASAGRQFSGRATLEEAVCRELLLRNDLSLKHQFHLAPEKETSLDLYLVTSGEKSVEMDSSRHFSSESLLAISFWVANVNASLPSSNRSGGCS